MHAMCQYGCLVFFTWISLSAGEDDNSTAGFDTFGEPSNVSVLPDTLHSACGSTLHSETGVITSPGYPDNYPNTQNCTWIIMAPANRQIRLKIIPFHLESCPYDYLEIRNGGFSTSPLVGRFCGTTITSPLVSHSNTMWLRFVSDNSRAYSGFCIVYDGTATGCGGDLTTPTGSLTSPNYPNPYTHNSECFWTIRGAQGSSLQLTFQDLDVETHSQCSLDYLEIRENGPTGYQIGDRVCGTTIPSPVNTTASRMWIKYRTDSSVNGRGFNATYNINCRNRLTAAHSGVIESINYPDTYHNNQNCSWLIAATASNTVNISFETFHLESGSGCPYDYLEILDGESPSSPSLGRFCDDNITTPITSTTNRVRINFVTDNSVTYGGFRLQYVTNGCGGDLTTPTGSFTSPNYPNPYTHNSECFWTIRGAQGSGLHLTFQDLDVETHSECHFDYLEIRENGPTGYQIGDRVCGTTIPSPVNTTASRMWIKYRTDSSVNGRGFSATYNINCRNRLTADSGVIESINYPDTYHNNQNCSWLIAATAGNTVNISFETFHLESGSGCPYDYLEILDGENPSSPSLGKFCDDNIPTPVTSTTNRVRVNFVTDMSVTHGGFRLQYVTNGCGGMLSGPSGNFTSPNYPNPYQHATTCEWTITVNTSYAISLTFHDFDIESHQNCHFDAVEVYAGRDDRGPQLTKLCHSQTTAQVTQSTGNVIFVRMRTDSSISGRGFSASWTQIPGGCGGTYSTRNGFIMSKNYPSNYPHNTECEWLISLPVNHPIIFNITDLDIEGGSCGNDYLDLYDGPNTNSRRMARLCGREIPGNSTYRASNNVMYVKMRTDSSVTGRGFKAQYYPDSGP